MAVIYMFVHDLIKIKLIREGYLPNYPYHMISDSEMCDAFLCHKPGNGPVAADDQYFYYAYPLMNGSSSEVIKAWKNLRKSILYHLHMLKYHENLYECPECRKGFWQKENKHTEQCPDCKVKLITSGYTVPDWVYSYMLGEVIGPHSEILDIHDLILPLGADNIDDEFGAEQAQACFEVSKRWISKINDVKFYILTSEDIVNLHLTSSLFKAGDSVELRPATVFGEPHVIKSIRLSQLSMI